MYDLKGKVALVTGSARGIGSSIALGLAQSGAAVAINYMQSRKGAKALAGRINEQGSQAIALKADVRNSVHVRKLISAVERTFGKLDILVNNVGDILFKPLSHTSEADWRNMLDSNLNSTFTVCSAALPGMRGRRYGRIVNIALANAAQLRAYERITPYVIAKTGVLIYTQSLAKAEAAHGITVNAVSPGFIDDSETSVELKRSWEGKIPAGRLGSSDEVAAAVLFLVSDSASYITGTNIIVSGGWGL